MRDRCMETVTRPSCQPHLSIMGGHGKLVRLAQAHRQWQRLNVQAVVQQRDGNLCPPATPHTFYLCCLAPSTSVRAWAWRAGRAGRSFAQSPICRH